MPTDPDDGSQARPGIDDTSPVGDAELLMRRVLKRLAEFNRAQVPPLQEGAFLPTKRDADGLSLNRMFTEASPTFLTPRQIKEWHEVPESIRSTCGVIEVLAGAARELGLTVDPDPAGTPGHVLIREINWIDFSDLERPEARLKIRAWALTLARQASVLIAPGS